MGDLAVDLGDWFEVHATEIRANLERYFLGVGGDPFNGRHFERFSAMGDPNRFEATDILAVEALSVGVPPNSAAKLLDTEAEHFNSLLRQIPADRTLWEVPDYVLADTGPAGKLHARLQHDLDGVGWVTAGKLMSSKRPLLIPILDDIVKQVLKPPRKRFWSTMRKQLSDERRRERIRRVVSFPLGDVAFLRRIDVAVWMHGKSATQIICYHTTDAAEAILRNGFRDATGGYMFAKTKLTGVWLGDSPMSLNEGAKGEQVLRVEFGNAADLDGCEVLEEHKGYREWCVPAEIINTRATVTLLSQEEVDEIEDRLWRERHQDGPPDWLRPLNRPESHAD